MDMIGRMIDEPNTTKRFCYFLCFIPVFWIAFAALISSVFVAANAIWYSLYFIGWLISLVVG